MKEISNKPMVEVMEIMEEERLSGRDFMKIIGRHKNRIYEKYHSYKQYSMQTPASRGCTLSKFERHPFYFVINFNRNTANDFPIFGV